MTSKHQGNVNKGNQKGGDQKMDVDREKPIGGKPGSNNQATLGGNPDPAPASGKSDASQKH